MTTYRLASSPVVNTPGVIAWAINAYSFDDDRPMMLKTVSATFPQVPAEAIKQLLSTAVPYTVEGETVVFTAKEADAAVQYQIFDSMDRPSGRKADREQDLYDELEQLRAEAEEEGSRLTYAIGKILPNGDVTHDY